MSNTYFIQFSMLVRNGFRKFRFNKTALLLSDFGPVFGGGSFWCKVFLFILFTFLFIFTSYSFTLTLREGSPFSFFSGSAAIPPKGICAISL